MKLTTNSKKEIFQEFGGATTNTGSTEAQIAIFTHRINHISQHLTSNRKDFSNTRSLLKLVGKRRRLLNYLSKNDITKYRTLIERLGIRK